MDVRTSARALNWRAAALLGIVSSTFSTIVSQLTAGRIGRDAAVDWMVVATIPLRDGALQIEPSWGVILVGILFHQWADFSWVLVFFGLLGRLTAGLRPLTILAVAMPWAVLTSALEWLFLVPLVPFWQPVFPLQQVYWIGLLVHVSSASMYPLFPYVRDRLAGRSSPQGRFAALWSGLALAGTLALGTVAILGSQGRELPRVGGDPSFDRSYMRRMAAHHAQGVELAKLAAERAADPHLRALARLMVASQQGDLKIFSQWWRSWFSGSLPPPSHEDHAAMRGMIPTGEISALRHIGIDNFDTLFITLMTRHHEGAIAMAEEAIRRANDPRLRLMAHALRHAQKGEIALMDGARGLAAVRIALQALLW
jgi:uncharacterized protein (DUF305 family)